MLRAFFLGVLVWAAPMAQAHPHVFVDVGLTFETNEDGQITAVLVRWKYDGLFTLLVLADGGYDADADLKLTEEEKAALLGFELTDWPEGFDGALFLQRGTQTLVLGAPEALSVDIEEGQLVTVHRRTFAPTDPDALVVEPFDPYYYADLTLRSVSGLPDSCETRITRPDKAEVAEWVAGLGNQTGEDFFEEFRVGKYYTDRLEVTCATS